MISTSCDGDHSTTADSTEANADAAPEKTKTQYLRAPLDIVPSTGEDYPQSLIDVGFPVIPNTGITTVGNTEIKNGTVVMQMETLKSIEEIKAFYDKEMDANGWEIRHINIFQGADAAYSYRNEDYSVRILVLNDKVQDYRKLAVTLNNRVNAEDFN